jgi:hypothetical protein
MLTLFGLSLRKQLLGCLAHEGVVLGSDTRCGGHDKRGDEGDDEEELVELHA